MTLPLVHVVFAVFETGLRYLGSSVSSEESSESSSPCSSGNLVGRFGGFLGALDGGLVHLRRGLFGLCHLVTLDRADTADLRLRLLGFVGRRVPFGGLLGCDVSFGFRLLGVEFGLFVGNLVGSHGCFLRALD